MISEYLSPECKYSILAASPTANLKSPVYSTVPWAPSNRNLCLKSVLIQNWLSLCSWCMFMLLFCLHDWSWTVSRWKQSDDNILWLNRKTNTTSDQLRNTLESKLGAKHPPLQWFHLSEVCELDCPVPVGPSMQRFSY